MKINALCLTKRVDKISTRWQNLKRLTKYHSHRIFGVAREVQPNSGEVQPQLTSTKRSSRSPPVQKQLTAPACSVASFRATWNILDRCNGNWSRAKKVIYEDVAHWNAHIWERTLWWKQSNQFSSYHPLGLSKRLSFAATRFIEFLLETRRMKRLLEN